MSVAAQIDELETQTLRIDLNALAIRLSSRGDVDGSRVCCRAATELTLRKGEDQLAAAQARCAESEAELMREAAAAARRIVAASRKPA